MTDPHQHGASEDLAALVRARDLSLDHQLALRSAASRLEAEFRGVFNPETTGRFLATSYEQFERQAVVPHYVTTLAERFARQRLKAFARVEGFIQDGKPVVLFLCVHNAGKSQMALGFFAHHAGGDAIAWSGGSEPSTTLNKHSVAAMAELGIDIAQDFPKPWTEETLRAADVIVTMGCAEACPVYPGKRYLDWELDAPPATSLEAVRPVRDEIERRVLALLGDLGLPVPPPLSAPRAEARPQ